LHLFTEQGHFTMIKETIEKSILLPEGFSATADKNSLTIKSANSETSRSFRARGISFKVEDNSIILQGCPASRKMNALLLTIALHVKNMVAVLQRPYQCRLAVIYSHFPMNLAVKGNKVEINNFTGEKHPRYAKILPGVNVEIKGKEVLVKGIDKEAVGQTAANLENATKVRGKDRRIYQDGVFIVEKTKTLTVEKERARTEEKVKQ